MPESVNLPNIGETENNHFHAVDLGLSVKWACCNVGASNSWEVGELYEWGQTDLNSELDSDADIGTLICGTCYDVAYVKWKDNWRMPTKEEFEELCEKCFWEWTSINNVEGYLVIAPNRNSIFLPATDGKNYRPEGGYWTGTLHEEYGLTYFAYSLTFNDLVKYLTYNGRLNKLAIRPVKD